MKIKNVKTAKKIGEFKKRDNSPNKIKIEYCVGNDILKNDAPRVYLIVSNGEIKKIGGSASKGGIKSTMDFYVNAMQGSPGRPRFIVHLLIRKELDKGKKVELYMIQSEPVEAKIPGLFGYHKIKISSYKEMEDLCKKDYYERMKRYPDWNFQENNESYPRELEEEFIKYHQNRIK